MQAVYIIDTSVANGLYVASIFLTTIYNIYQVEEMASVKTKLPSLHLHLDDSLSDLSLSDPEEGEGDLDLEGQGN